VRVLLDENLPRDLVTELSGHDVATVQGLGWAGMRNGELLKRASGQVEVFITMDRRLAEEHDLTVLPFGRVAVWRVGRSREFEPNSRSQALGEDS
jgi:hypothetical protein